MFLIDASLGIGRVSRSDEPEDAASPRSEEDGQIPSGSRLSDKTQALLPGTSDKGLIENDLFNFGQRNSVATNVLFAIWLNNELIDPHVASSF